MKITLSPTTEEYATVSVDHPNDDLDIGDLIEQVVVPALKAWGYSDEVIGEFLK